MKRTGGFIFILLLFLVCSGCDLFTPWKKRARPGPVRAKVESVAIADKILRPQPYELKISKDPFKPVVERTATYSQAEGISEKEIWDAQVMGIVELGDVHCALIRIDDKTKTYRVKDMLGPWEITGIEAREVFLRKDDEEMILKVGGEDEE